MPIDDTDPPKEEPPAGSPFRHAIFRNVWIASLFSNFGGLIQSVGASWLMTSIATSADLVALVQASMTLPIMLFSLPAGALADNFDRRKVMISAQCFLFVISVALALLSYAGGMTPWLLLCFTFLIGVGTAFNGPAWQSLVGEMVPRSEIPAAIALNSMGFNIARSVGPAIGGMIVAAYGAFAAFAINSVSYIGILTVLARWKPVSTPRVLPPEGLVHAMGAGVRYVAMSPVILTVLARGMVFGLGGVALQALLPLIARDSVGGGPLTYGILLGAFGIGAVAGAAAGHRLRSRLTIERMIELAFGSFAFAALLAAYSGTLWLTAPALAIAGASWVLSLSSFNTTVQLSSPRWVVGRAVALYQMTTFGGMALGSWMWGVLAERYDLSFALMLSAGVLIIGALMGRWLALPDTQALNLDPLGTWRKPDMAVDIQPRSGPIVVTVDYSIHPENALTFLNLMAERKRVRIRDGARRWTLLRDLQDAEKWVERYHLPTWTDYLRHNERMTKADSDIRERLLELDHSAGTTRVHRFIERQVGHAHDQGVDRLHGLADPARHTHGAG